MILWFTFFYEKLIVSRNYYEPQNIYSTSNAINTTEHAIRHTSPNTNQLTAPIYAAVGMSRNDYATLQQEQQNAQQQQQQQQLQINQPHQPHDSCYCFDCQDYRAANRFRNAQYSNYNSQYSPASSNTNNIGLQEGQIQKFNDLRKVGSGTINISPQQIQHSPLMNNKMVGQTQVTWLGAGGIPRRNINLLDAAQDSGQYELSEVILERQTTGFGFRIVGGTEEGSQVTVGHVVPGGAADMNHRITTGDEILSIDGINVLNASHHKVVSLMGEAALRGSVTMIMRRRIQQQQQQQQQIYYQQTLNLQQHQSPMATNRSQYYFPYDIVVKRNENEGFGFVIISSSNQYLGSTIGKLIPSSPADRCGKLKVGDHIIAVNRIDIAGIPHGDVVNLIKESGLQVRLTIGCPNENNQPILDTNSSLSTTNIMQSSPRLLGTSLTPSFLQNQLQQPQLLTTTKRNVTENSPSFMFDRTNTFGNNLNTNSKLTKLDEPLQNSNEI